jgi:hypothetical protein
MAHFNDYLAALETALASFAETSFASVKDAAIQDGKIFVQQSSAKLERWTGLLATKQLAQEDFAWLVSSQKDLIEMEALEQAGLNQATLDRFGAGLLNLIIGTALKVFAP